MDPLEVLYSFYPEDTPLRRLLLKHSMQVCRKALQILDESRTNVTLNREIVSAGAILHDVGIQLCHAPDIFCEGPEPYIAHGILGAKMLRKYGELHDIDMECYARICERHTGAGITAQQIRKQNFPIPLFDYLPETPEEKLICLADKFFSKSGDLKEKSMAKVTASLRKFGPDTLLRFFQMCSLFGLKSEEMF